MRLQKYVVVGALLCALLTPGLAEARRRKKSQEPNFLDLATVLVRDGAYSRAVGVLAQVDPEDEKTDLARLYLLRGLAELNLGLYRQAAVDLSASIKAGQEDPIARIYLAQAYFYAHEYKESLQALNSARERAAQIRSSYALAAEALWKLGKRSEAWDRLTEGEARYPDYMELPRRKVYFAVEQGLYRTAADLGRAYLKRTGAKAEDYLALGAALQQSHQGGDEALGLLELAHMYFPNNPQVTIALARTYKARGDYLIAAEVLERAAIQLGEDDLTVEAGELFKQAGKPFRALGLNARIKNSKKRLRQRLSVLLELRRYELVATMARPLARVGLIKDERVRYAVAYAQFKAKNYKQAASLLKGISDPELFRQAVQLRKAMADCRSDPWRC